MPNIIRDFEKDTYYHIYNRGFNKQPLFLQDADYIRFLKRIKQYQEDFPTIKIEEFCLLPNHFHFLLKDEWVEDRDDLNFNYGLISHFMKGVELSHAMYFSTKYADFLRNGKKMPMFEGRFRSKLIGSDDYGERIENYIRFNAVKHGLVKSPKDWKYSSYSNKKGKFDEAYFREVSNCLAPEFEF